MGRNLWIINSPFQLANNSSRHTNKLPILPRHPPHVVKLHQQLIPTKPKFVSVGRKLSCRTLNNNINYSSFERHSKAPTTPFPLFLHFNMVAKQKQADGKFFTIILWSFLSTTLIIILMLTISPHIRLLLLLPTRWGVEFTILMGISFGCWVKL